MWLSQKINSFFLTTWLTWISFLLGESWLYMGQCWRLNTRHAFTCVDLESTKFSIRNVCSTPPTGGGLEAVKCSDFLLINPNFFRGTILFLMNVDDIAWIKLPVSNELFTGLPENPVPGTYLGGNSLKQEKMFVALPLPCFLTMWAVSQMIKPQWPGVKHSLADPRGAVKSKMPQGHMLLTFCCITGIKTQFMGGNASVLSTLLLLVCQE